MKLPKNWIDYLVQQPETGMGWQKCDIEDKGGIHTDVIVMNSEDVIGVDVDSIISISVTRR